MAETILDKMAAAENLPSLPTVAIEILNLSRSDDTCVDDIAQVIQNDPALVARMLKVVNSSLFGLSRKVASIKHGVALLGMRSVKVMALSFTLVEMMREHKDGGFDYQAFWRSSLTTAVTARQLAEETHPKLKEEAFIAGLLTDLGLMAAYRCAPDQVQPLIKDWHDTGRYNQELERATLGASHAALTAQLLAGWGLPELLCDAIAAHHGERFDELEGQTRQLGGLLRAAAEVARLFTEPEAGDDLNQIKSNCQEWTDIDAEALESMLTNVHESVREAASLLSLDIGETTSYADLQARATQQLAMLSVEAEVERKRASQREISAVMAAQQLRRENKLILRTASIDALTCLANRSAFDCRLDEELHDSDRGDQTLGLILLDVDHFKQVNDLHGHQAGDAVLRHIGALLDQATRGVGYAARYGGEEFVILLAREATEQIGELAEQIRRAIEESQICYNGETLSVTASLGAVHCEAKARPQSAEDLINAADGCLYQAKSSGRNRVVKTGWGHSTT